MNKLLKTHGAIAFLTVIFLNALIDVGHKIIIQNTIFKIYDDQTQVILTAIVNALILLPFVLLMSPAGFISDQSPKNHVMRFTGWVAFGTALCITYCYYQGWFWAAFSLTLVLAIQSAFYGPAKLSYLAPLFGKDNLAQANGLAQSASITAILAATGLFSWFFESRFDANWAQESDVIRGIAPVGWFLIFNSVIELALIYRLPTLESPPKKTRFDWKAYKRGQLMRDKLHIFSQHQTIRLSIIGLSVFWSVGQVMLAAFPAHAKSQFGITNTMAIQGAMAASGIGIAIGAVLAGRWSRSHIETGLIPLGALGVTLGLFWLPNAIDTATQAFTFFLIGVAGSLFIVPLNALIQFNASDSERGSIIALTNWIQTLAMLAFLTLTVVLALLNINTLWLLYFIAIVACVGCLYTVYRIPQSLIRFVFTALLTQHYRVNTQGVEHIPEKGPVLFLGNHISWIDWAILQIACPRPIRFVMIKSIYDRWYLNGFLRLMGCIPIEQGPNSQKAIDDITALLENGEAVCLFPEGKISRTGHLAEFRHGYLRATEKVSAPVQIVPFYLRGLWGSQFSRASTHTQSLNQAGITRDLVVTFGQPVPKDTPPDRLKQQVFDLSIDAWEQYAHSLDTLPAAWLKTAKGALSKTATLEATHSETNHTTKISNRAMLAQSLWLSRQIRSTVKDSLLGFVLPTSSTQMTANMAALFAGKTITNLNYTYGFKAFKHTIQSTQLKNLCTTQAFFNTLLEQGYPLDQLDVQWVILDHFQTKFTPQTQRWMKIAVTLTPSAVLNVLFNRAKHANDCATLVFSSGTTDLPKAIRLSHRNIMANAKQASDVLNLQEQDITMAALPSFHAYAMTVNQFMPLLCGLPIVCHPDPMDGEGLAKRVTQNNTTLLCSTPAMLDKLAREERIHPLMLQPLRLVISGGHKLTDNTRQAFEQKFNKPIMEGYGTTETTPIASVNLPDALDTRTWKVQLGGKKGTVGMPLPGTSFKIIDPITQAEKNTGEAGVILIGGTQIMLGYVNPPQTQNSTQTQPTVMLDGRQWFITEDIGYLDEDGFLTILGRDPQALSEPPTPPHNTPVDETTSGE